MRVTSTFYFPSLIFNHPMSPFHLKIPIQRADGVKQMFTMVTERKNLHDRQKV